MKHPRPLGQRVIGIAVGVATALVVLSLLTPRLRGRGRTGPILSESEGALRSIVIQYVADASFAVSVYRQFLPALPANVVVHVVCPDEAAYQQLLAELPPVKCSLRPLLVHHPMTAWSRDRWALLRPGHANGPVTLLYSRGEEAAASWPQRAGDERIAASIAGALAQQVESRPSSLFFDGGDFCTDDQAVVAIPRLVERNVQHTVQSKQELQSVLAAELGRRIILLDDAPDHHAGMFMMLIGQQTALVGDPSLVKPLITPAVATALLDDPDYSAATQAKFDAVARQLEREGYSVVRIPTVASTDGKTYLTYLNGLIDCRDGRRAVYLPVYRGADAVNAAAADVWRAMGFDVHPIDCTDVYRNFGTLHCLVNVLDRSAEK